MIYTLLTVIDNTSGNSSSAIASAGEAGVASTAGFGMIGTILYILFLIAVFYFFALRPQKKREDEIKLVQANLAVNDYVLLDSGIYGRIKDINDNVFIVEIGINKGVLVPVLKTRIIGKGEPDLTSTKK
ncbi:MAG: preprotein translocase subunit YajC [bacterium]